ncbi:hypothetical protein CJ030_MR1G014973 [Morella rubra]|uniref:non-specific serine/threonine protein kinase n=1 Tax=Morella rubra TaxID=262757 RepID=A0A6A1WNU2_9ROSI|nr:hypothetical protein CJ030_MR1G014973 [Morella rubra]
MPSQNASTLGGILFQRASTIDNVGAPLLLDDSTGIVQGRAEKEFKVEVEAIERVRHKNLVRLLGYCAEGVHRLTYLHEGLEPKVVHRDIKSSNILVDKQWNPKVSDFGLAKLLGSELSYITTRVMGTVGYVAPQYASIGMLNERSDVYIFGILIMEIISGRNPVDYIRPPEEVKGCGEASCDSLFSAQFQGYMLGILSACLSALAGVYTEFLMKKNNDSLYWQNVQLYT